jgi:hypothetical protein
MGAPRIPVAFPFQSQEAMVYKLLIGPLNACLTHTQRIRCLSIGQRQTTIVAAVVACVKFQS